MDSKAPEFGIAIGVALEVGYKKDGKVIWGTRKLLFHTSSLKSTICSLQEDSLCSSTASVLVS